MKTQTAVEQNEATPSLPAGVRRIVLIGFMGAGKTTIGRLLAARLGWGFLDLDAHLETREGATVRQIFAERGEEHFRRVESTALANALAAHKTVLALGGGAPESLTNRLLVEQTPGTLVIFLDASFPVLYDRCMLDELNTGAAQIRPMLADPAEAETRFRARQPHYRRLARLKLNTEKIGPTAVVEEMMEQLENVR